MNDRPLLEEVEVQAVFVHLWLGRLAILEARRW